MKYDFSDSLESDMPDYDDTLVIESVQEITYYSESDSSSLPEASKKESVKENERTMPREGNNIYIENSLVSLNKEPLFLSAINSPSNADENLGFGKHLTNAASNVSFLNEERVPPKIRKGYAENIKDLQFFVITGIEVHELH